MRNNMKKLLVFILTIALVVTTIPSAFLGTAYAAAGPSDGQVEYVGGANSTKEGTRYDIEVSKTIEAVEGKENYFDITLKTTTHRHHVDMSTDVIVVMDISNTMNFDPVSGSGTKLDQAKAATNQFLKQFAEDENLSSDRRAGVVTFNQNAQVAVELQEANDAGDYLKNFKGKVDSITAPKEPVEIKFTNIEGGLQLASNILAASDAKYKFVILLTDGFPTTYIQSSKTSTTKIYGYDTYMSHTADYSSYKSSYIGKNASGTLKKPGYMANVALGKPCLYGVDYSDYGAQRAQAIAGEMKKNNMNIFSVGIGIGGMTIANYLNTHAGKIFSTVDTNGMGSSYVIGSPTNTDSYKSWLGDKIAGGNLLTANNVSRYSDGNSSTQLAKAYSNILDTIEMAPETTMREFYTLDPMSVEADFIGFYDKNGKLASNPNKLVGESKQNAENTAVYGGAGNEGKINWEMLQSGYTMEGENLVFTLKYRVRLMNEKSGFKWKTAYDMNDKTTLNYSQKYTESGEDVPDGTGVLEYPIPETEGYKGNLKFKKVDGDTNKALAGVEFTLEHYGASCSVCGGDATIADVKATSDAEGYVGFDNIPSGHEYLLIEKEPEGYAPVHNHLIIVSYGDTYVGTKAPANKLTDGVFKAKNEAFNVVNTKVEPVEIKLQATKTMDGIAATDSYKFLMEGKDAHGTDHHEIVSNDSSGKVTFGSVTYDAPGTYEYTVSEVTGTDAGIVYDKAKHAAKIVVSKTADGKAYQAVVTIDNGSPATYVGKDNVIETVNVGTFNNKTRSEGSAILEAKKNYEGGSLTAGDFEFKVTAVTDGAPLPADVTAENDADGTVSFDKISYKTPGKYEYKISEIKGEDNSVVYDLSTYNAVVTVTAPKDLTSDTKLQTSVEYTDKDGKKVDIPTFNNKDRKTPVITMEGHKTLNGKDAAKDAFTFVFQEIDNNGNAVGTPTEINNGENGTINFNGALEAVVKELIAEVDGSAEGVAPARNYKIYEKAGSDPNIEYDDTYYLLEMGAFVQEGTEYYQLAAMLGKVDGGNIESIFRIEESNKIEVADGSGDPLVKFENTSKVQLQLEATKKLESVTTTMKVGDYTFVLEDEDGVLQEVTNDKDGKVTFAPVEFTAADVGSKSFVVYEKEGNNPGLWYDDSLYTVTAEVSVDKNGILSVGEPVIKDEYDKSFTDLVFVNKDLTSTHLHFQAMKTVDGKMPTVAQEFSFELIDDNAGSVIETIHNVHGTIAFSEVDLTEKGTYNYTIREVLPADDDPDKEGIQKDGYTYDKTEHKVKVDVTDKNNDGVLEKDVTVNGKKDSADHNTVVAGAFDNTYEADPVSVKLEASKKLTGRDWFESDKFIFKLTPDNETAKAVDKGDVVIGSDTVTVDYDDEDKKVEFDKLTFKEQGTYIFDITEVEGDIDSVAYDPHKTRVTVTITDSGEGELIAGVTYAGSTEFTNVFTPDPVKVVMEGDKVLAGRELEDGEFDFSIEAVTEGAPVPADTVVTNDTEGNIKFGAIYYNEEGTYEYLIKEKAGSLPSVTYDGETVKATVVVEYDESKGIFNTAVSYDKAGKSEFVFNNKYQAVPVNVSVNAAKYVEPTAGNSYTMGAGTFSFVLDPAAENPASDPISKQTITHDAAGSMGFSAAYTEAGTYIYSLHEASGDHGGIVFDDAVYEIIVTVTDNTDTGKLAANVSLKKNGTSVDSIVFNNKYDPTETSAMIYGQKLINGGAKETAEGDFAFTIKALTEDAPMPAETTVRNAETGVFQFDTIIYKAPGTYEYEVSEVNTGKTGYTYDYSKYKVTVTVEDNGGALEAKVDGVHTADNKSLIVFNNYYDPIDGSVTISGQKNLDGRELAEGEFEFLLMDGDSVVGTAKNTAEGTFAFTIPFDKPGEYAYTVVEKDTGAAGVTYDLLTTYGIDFTVIDDGGYLRVDGAVDIYKDGAAAEGIVFNNSYSAMPTSIQLTALKVMKGKELKEGEFDFVLEDAEGNKIQTVSNAADGTITFEEIKYETVGTYTYKMYEDAGIRGSIAYDDTVYEITVNVTDDLKGNLKAEILKDVSVPVFVNIYEFGGGFGDGGSDDGDPEDRSAATGDNSNMLPFAIAALAAFAGAAAALFRRKNED